MTVTPIWGRPVNDLKIFAVIYNLIWIQTFLITRIIRRTAGGGSQMVATPICDQESIRPGPDKFPADWSYLFHLCLPAHKCIQNGNTIFHMPPGQMQRSYYIRSESFLPYPSGDQRIPAAAAYPLPASEMPPQLPNSSGSRHLGDVLKGVRLNSPDSETRGAIPRPNHASYPQVTEGSPRPPDIHPAGKARGPRISCPVSRQALIRSPFPGQSCKKSLPSTLI